MAELLRPGQAAAICGLSTKTLAKLAHAGRIPGAVELRKYPGDAEASQAVMDAIITLLPPLLEQLGPAAVLDGLASLYVSLAVGWLGEEQASGALRRYLKALPRIAARGKTRGGNG